MRKVFGLVVAALIGASAAHAQSTLRAPSAAEVRLYARLMAMTDARKLDRIVVDSALVSTWSPLRAAGALAIGQVGPRHGKPGLAILDSLLTAPDLDSRVERRVLARTSSRLDFNRVARCALSVVARRLHEKPRGRLAKSARLRGAQLSPVFRHLVTTMRSRSSC